MLQKYHIAEPTGIGWNHHFFHRCSYNLLISFAKSPLLTTSCSHSPGGVGGFDFSGSAPVRRSVLAPPCSRGLIF
ncbi:hypothetical protein T4C_8384 [Trichinella pseudospiralis]|uniref:Uncharacterized protein n=1 Tax=Trichinella pseudospiralis TaxID=6337 RepID=A0A0V1KDH2_TRIPS|nr:hypothetical protein T4C_8384 [Trichinella pseudospiralis]